MTTVKVSELLLRSQYGRGKVLLLACLDVCFCLCLFVCLSARTSQKPRLSFTTFSVHITVLPVTVARSPSGGNALGYAMCYWLINWLIYVLLVLWMTCFHTNEWMGQNQWWGICFIQFARWHTIKSKVCHLQLHLVGWSEFNGAFNTI